MPGFMLSAAHWPDVEAGPRRLLVVPVGSLEQHGPHLPLDTDTRIACAAAETACAGRAGVGLAPAIAIGASGEHADFPGTLSIGHVALSTLLIELGRHASLHWPSMLLVNGHGGNVAAIKDALGTLHAEGRDCHVWHTGVRPSMLAAAQAGGDGERAAGESGAGQADPILAPDAHAGRVETSIMLALAPADVRLDVAAPGETRPLTEIMPGLRDHGVRHVSRNGVLGDPTGASAAEGKALLDFLAADLAAILDRLAEPRALQAGGASLEAVTACRPDVVSREGRQCPPTATPGRNGGTARTGSRPRSQPSRSRKWKPRRRPSRSRGTIPRSRCSGSTRSNRSTGSTRSNRCSGSSQRSRPTALSHVSSPCRDSRIPAGEPHGSARAAVANAY